jgi:hypothetical protein
MNGFWITVDVDDNFSESLFVSAIPPLGTLMRIQNRGAFKVKEIEFQGTTAVSTSEGGQPAKIIVHCVPVLAF